MTMKMLSYKAVMVYFSIPEKEYKIPSNTHARETGNYHHILTIIVKCKTPLTLGPETTSQASMVVL